MTGSNIRKRQFITPEEAQEMLTMYIDDFRGINADLNGIHCLRLADAGVECECWCCEFDELLTEMELMIADIPERTEGNLEGLEDLVDIAEEEAGRSKTVVAVPTVTKEVVTNINDKSSCAKPGKMFEPIKE